MSRRTWFNNIILAILLAAGVQAAIFVVMAIVYKPVRNVLESFPTGRLRVHRNGQVVLADPGGGYRSVSGQPLDNADIARRFLNVPLVWLSPTWIPGPLPDYQRGLRLGWSSRLSELSDDAQVRWFVVHSPIYDGFAYFIGYDERTRDTFGYLGRSGFRPSLPPREEWFAMAGDPRTRLVAHSSVGSTPVGLPVTVTTAAAPQGRVYMPADAQLWEVDLNARSVRVLYDAAPTISVAAAVTTEGKPELLVRTTSEIVATDFQGRRRTSWKLPAELQKVQIAWYEFADGTALAQTQRAVENAIFVDLTWLNPDGTVTQTAELEPYREHSFKPQATYFAMAAACPMPLFMTTMTCIDMPSGAVERGVHPDFPKALAYTLADAWPALLTLYLLSAVLAWLTYRRQVRYALPGAGAWAVFVFLLGVPGWLAYRWHRRWPVTEACGECHRPAPRDRENCASCGHLFAPPPLLGTEIFAES